MNEETTIRSNIKVPYNQATKIIIAEPKKQRKTHWPSVFFGLFLAACVLDLIWMY